MTKLPYITDFLALHIVNPQDTGIFQPASQLHGLRSFISTCPLPSKGYPTLGPKVNTDRNTFVPHFNIFNSMDNSEARQGFIMETWTYWYLPLLISPYLPGRLRCLEILIVKPIDPFLFCILGWQHRTAKLAGEDVSFGGWRHRATTKADNFERKCLNR